VDPIKQEVLAVYCSLLGNMVARKRAEEEQRHAVDQQRQFMERTDRLNSLGLLAAGMAHEINNPLQGMLSHLHAVQRALPKEFAAQRSLEMLERGIETIATLVRKLLFLGTTEQGLEVADARESMDFVAQLLDSQLKRARVRLELRRPDRRVALAMPRRELIQILLNLMINARDAMPQGGALTVGFRVEDQMGILTIADTGNGIPPEILGRIFTPFFTTKGTKGTGLGLSVAESLVRSAGGVIQVQSRPGQGTLFTVRIPLARGDADMNEHVLVIDDDELVRTGLADQPGAGRLPRLHRRRRGRGPGGWRPASAWTWSCATWCWATWTASKCCAASGPSRPTPA
jgi:signal transduction histidine kinase